VVGIWSYPQTEDILSYPQAYGVILRITELSSVILTLLDFNLILNKDGCLRSEAVCTLQKKYQTSVSLKLFSLGKKWS
jgi:hypothetical protein